MLALDLIAEEKIRDAMRAGAFDDLPGAGQPLALDDDRLIPEELRIAYRILKNAGCLPQEIEARKEAATLRKLISAATEDAARRRALTKLALIEACLEAQGTALPRASGYFHRVVQRFERG
ncbi:MAG TPA: DnaJ family domain-containing protein [Casimicrobiaceae bacterium]